MKILIKHKAYPEGTIRKWKDGTTRKKIGKLWVCLLYTSPSPRDLSTSRMPSSA